jgi:hypothetical protein
MPSWLLLVLVVTGMVLLVSLEAAAVTGSWRTFWVALKQFGGVVLGIAVFCFLFWVVAVIAHS